MGCFGPRLCENSVRHGRVGNDVLPLEQLQYFVLMLAATGGLLRKLFSSESRNWNFHTASAVGYYEMNCVELYL